MSALANVVTGTFLVVAAALAVVAGRAWVQTRSPKVAWLAGGFALFAAKGAFLSYVLFREPSWEQAALVPSLAIDIAALLMFYAAVFHKTS